MTLAEFLIARIADDEKRARACEEAIDPVGDQVSDGIDAIGEPFAEHIRNWDPVRVIIECDLKRRLLDELADMSAEHGVNIAASIKVLAMPYSNHPEYREEWKPPNFL